MAGIAVADRHRQLSLRYERITLPLTVVNEGSHDLVLANAKGQFTLRLNRNGDGWSGQATWKDMTLPCVLN